MNAEAVVATTNPVAHKAEVKDSAEIICNLKDVSLRKDEGKNFVQQKYLFALNGEAEAQRYLLLRGKGAGDEMFISLPQNECGSHRELHRIAERLAGKSLTPIGGGFVREDGDALAFYGASQSFGAVNPQILAQTLVEHFPTLKVKLPSHAALEDCQKKIEESLYETRIMASGAEALAQDPRNTRALGFCDELWKRYTCDAYLEVHRKVSDLLYGQGKGDRTLEEAVTLSGSQDAKAHLLKMKTLIPEKVSDQEDIFSLLCSGRRDSFQKGMAGVNSLMAQVESVFHDVKTAINTNDGQGFVLSEICQRLGTDRKPTQSEKPQGLENSQIPKVADPKHSQAIAATSHLAAQAPGMLNTKVLPAYPEDMSLLKISRGSVSANNQTLAELDPQEIMRKINNSFAAMRDRVIGRESVLEQTMLAVLCREHQLLYSRPGLAKSLLADTVAKAFSDASLFSIQLTKGTPEEGLVGGLKIEELKQGHYIHNTEGSAVRADFLFLDEVFDANDQALRTLLGILHERKFSKGKQQEVALCHSAIATTNYVRANDVTEAFLDRFMFRALLLPENEPYSQVRVDEAYTRGMGPRRNGAIPSLSMRELGFVSDIIEGRSERYSVHTPFEVLFMKNLVLDEYQRIANAEKKADQPEIYISPRTRAKTRDLLNAVAMLRGRMEVQSDDIPFLSLGITTQGNEDQGRWFKQAYQKVQNELLHAHLDGVITLGGMHEFLEDRVRRLQTGKMGDSAFMHIHRMTHRLPVAAVTTFDEIKGCVDKVKTDYPPLAALKTAMLSRIRREQAIWGEA